MDDIAAKAKLTKGTLYRHFNGKDQLLAHVLDVQHQLALRRVRSMSALPPKADIPLRHRDVHFVPTGDIQVAVGYY
jgi:AcrR family transcriptional regulator